MNAEPYLLDIRHSIELAGTALGEQELLAAFLKNLDEGDRHVKSKLYRWIGQLEPSAQLVPVVKRGLADFPPLEAMNVESEQYEECWYRGCDTMVAILERWYPESPIPRPLVMRKPDEQLAAWTAWLEGRETEKANTGDPESRPAISDDPKDPCSGAVPVRSDRRVRNNRPIAEIGYADFRGGQPSSFRQRKSLEFLATVYYPYNDLKFAERFIWIQPGQASYEVVQTVEPAIEVSGVLVKELRQRPVTSAIAQMRWSGGSLSKAESPLTAGH